jgi:hypothetical protein
MIAKQTTPVWKRHELVTKAIFEALLKQSNAENLEVSHNITIKGMMTSHQIDVFWKFRMGNLDHSVVAQVKKKKGPAKKGDLDIPGQPKGIFVSEQGYQKGALEVARAAGIAVYEIREISSEDFPDRITMTNLSIMVITQSPGNGLALEYQILEPTVSNLRLSLDGRWMAQHPQVLLGDVACSAIVSNIRFLDADGNERTSMQNLVQDRIREFKEAGQTLLETTFPDPTFADGLELLNQEGTSIVSIDILKIEQLTATLDIKKTIITRPLFGDKVSTYLLRKAIEDDHRYVLIAEDGSNLVANISLSIEAFRVG